MAQLLTDYVQSLLDLVLQMAPYLVLGFVLAGVTKVIFPKNWIQKHLGKGSWNDSLKATLFGVPLPICSCGIIPLAKELRKSGASNSGVASFLASTPQTGVDSIIATGGLMGWPFAIIRVAVAFISGILSGLAIAPFEKRKKELPARPTREKSSPATHFSPKKALHYGLIELPSDIRNSLTLGFFIAAAITLFLPEVQSFTSGDNLLLSYAFVMALAVPLYVCSTGSIPIALAMLTSGMTPGAALIFLIAGPATNVVTIATTTQIIGWRNTMIYLLTVIGVGWLSAYLLDSAFTFIPITEHLHHHHEESRGFLQIASTLVLITGLFGPSVLDFFKKGRKQFESENDMEAKKFEMKVEGMGCQKCVAKVNGIIGDVEGHQPISIDLESSKVIFSAITLNWDLLTEKLSAEDYSASDLVEL